MLVQPAEQFYLNKRASANWTSSKLLMLLGNLKRPTANCKSLQQAGTPLSFTKNKQVGWNLGTNHYLHTSRIAKNQSSNDFTAAAQKKNYNRV